MWQNLDDEPHRPRLTDPMEASRQLGTAVATLHTVDTSSIEIDETVYSDDELTRVQIRYYRPPHGIILVRTTRLDSRHHVLATGLRTSLAEAVLTLYDTEGEHGAAADHAHAHLELANALRDNAPTKHSVLVIDGHPHVAQLLEYQGRSALGAVGPSSHIIVAGHSQLLDEGLSVSLVRAPS